MNIYDYIRTGGIKGRTTGYPPIDEYITLADGIAYDWTGRPESGKSTFLFDILYNDTILNDNVNVLCHVPDIGKNEFYADMLWRMTGHTIDERYIAKGVPKLDERKAGPHVDWLEARFPVIEGKWTPIEVWEEAIKRGCSTVVIDSWNATNRPMQGFSREDQMLEHLLSERNIIAEQNSLQIHTIIHPTRTETDDSGQMRPPTAYNMKGGTEWNNNGKHQITVHRHDKMGNEATIYKLKSKPRSVGQNGTHSIFFNIKKFRYYCFENGKEMYFEDYRKRNFAKPQPKPKTENKPFELNDEDWAKYENL